MVSGEDFPHKANQTSRIFPASLPSSLDKGLTIGRADRTNAVLKKKPEESYLWQGGAPYHVNLFNLGLWYLKHFKTCLNQCGAPVR